MSESPVHYPGVRLLRDGAVRQRRLLVYRQRYGDRGQAAYRAQEHLNVDIPRFGQLDDVVLPEVIDMAGPVPNREADLARPRGRKGRDVVPVNRGEARPATVPEADPSWHPIAVKLRAALTESGQADFCQTSDWAFAFSLCEDLSLYKKSTKRSGQTLQTIYSAMERLLVVTEADRRRVLSSCPSRTITSSRRRCWPSLITG